MTRSVRTRSQPPGTHESERVSARTTRGWSTKRSGPHQDAKRGRGSRQLVVSGMWRTTICVVAQLALYWASVQYAW